jgi:protein gp37
MPTKIEWAEESWNPITGCTKISEGCHHCYAERMCYRLAGRYGYPERPNQFKTTFHQDKLTQPFVWKKPRMIFVCSMGDLFHPDVHTQWIDAVYAAAALNQQHTFLILTKRPEAMLEWYSYDAHYRTRACRVSEACGDYFGWGDMQVDPVQDWPLPNVWIGVTAENQKRADERIPILLKIPAEIRFVSIEPMLSQVDPFCAYSSDLGYVGGTIDWVICGGETGPGARPMHPDWVRSLLDQCVDASVPFFFKHWGGKKEAGRILDGRAWNEMPL